MSWHHSVYYPHYPHHPLYHSHPPLSQLLSNKKTNLFNPQTFLIFILTPHPAKLTMTNDSNHNSPTEINQAAILLRELYDDQTPELIPFKCQLFTEIKRIINFFMGETLKIHADIVRSTSFESLVPVIITYYNESLIDESKLTRISFDRVLLLIISRIAQENKINYYNWLFPKAPEIKKYIVNLRSIDQKTEQLFKTEHIHMKNNLTLSNPIQKIETEFVRSCYNLVADLKLTVITEIQRDDYSPTIETVKIRNYVHSALIYNGILRSIDDILVIVV